VTLLRTIYVIDATVLFVAFFFVLVGTMLLTAAGWRKTRLPRPYGRYLAIAIVVLVVAGAGLLGMKHYVKTKGREVVISRLTAVDPDTQVLINGSPAVNPAGLIRDIVAVRDVPAQHSYPGTPIHILITNADGTLELTLRRDSALSTEYWVYLPSADFTNGQEIGRFTSLRLDGVAPGN
jgi:hypothetical protein